MCSFCCITLLLGLPSHRPFCPPRGAEQQAVVASHHEPNGCASAQRPGDLCGARLLRAPEDQAGSRGKRFWLLLPRLAKVTGPARPWSAWVANKPALRRTTLAGINLGALKAHPTRFTRATPRHAQTLRQKTHHIHPDAGAIG